MSGPHRNPDKLNSIGIVVVGICGAVLVYVSIVALQAFYMDDTSEIQTMADYGGQDTAHKSLRAQQLDNIQRYEPKAPPQAPKAGEPAGQQLYTISIDDAIPLVVQAAKKDPKNLVPAIGPAVTPTVKPIFGRPRALQEPAGGGAAGGDAAGGAAGAGTPGGAAPATTPSDNPGAQTGVQMTPTGGQGPGGGAPPGTNNQPLQNPSGAPTKVESAPRNNPEPKKDPGPVAPRLQQPPTPPRATPAQPKAGGAAPAQPKGGAAKQPAPAPAQPKKGNAS